MLKKISLKGVILGALVNVGGTVIWAIAADVYLDIKYHIYLLPQIQQASKTQILAGQDLAIVVLNILVGGGFSILGGYIAARIAKHNELLNGTLSSFLCVVPAFFTIGSYPFFYILIEVLGNLLLGFIGGYLLLWKKKRSNKIKR